MFCIKGYTKHNVYSCFDENKNEWRYYTDYHLRDPLKLQCADLRCKGKAEIIDLETGSFRIYLDHTRDYEEHSYYLSQIRKKKKNIFDEYE